MRARLSPLAVLSKTVLAKAVPSKAVWVRIAALAIVLLVAIHAASARDGLESGGRARVASIIDGDTVVLADGREVRLVGIQAPKLPLGRPNFQAWPLADEAKAALERMIGGREVELGYGGARADRHGRQLAHLHAEDLHAEDGLWVQGEMLALGLARVYTFADNRSLAAALYTKEREARDARRGIWNHPYYRIRAADDLRRDNGTFQIVEGRVQGAALVKGRTYINFGTDHREDFTIIIPPRSRRSFDQLAPRPEALAGRVVRVRGWIQSLNGPMIEATHPEQIEVLNR
jgi:endonuclease YncB( thermonuclease family)